MGGGIHIMQNTGQNLKLSALVLLALPISAEIKQFYNKLK